VVQVVWSRRALADLAAIQTYIHGFRPLAAQRMAQRLRLAAESLSDHPDRGRIAGSFRELATVPPYLIRYRVTPDEIQIARIRHGARRPA
jgi:addiction module RelE/StbE family toxin